MLGSGVVGLVLVYCLFVVCGGLVVVICGIGVVGFGI